MAYNTIRLNLKESYKKLNEQLLEKIVSRTDASLELANQIITDLKIKAPQIATKLIIEYNQSHKCADIINKDIKQVVAQVYASINKEESKEHTRLAVVKQKTLDANPDKYTKYENKNNEFVIVKVKGVQNSYNKNNPELVKVVSSTTKEINKAAELIKNLLDDQDIKTEIIQEVEDK